MSQVVTLIVHCDLPKNQAIKVSQTGDEGRGVWLPRRHIEDRQPTGKFYQARIGAPKLAVAEFTIPDWLARDRGLM
jgi:hypothetical protein